MANRLVDHGSISIATNETDLLGVVEKVVLSVNNRHGGVIAIWCDTVYNPALDLLGRSVQRTYNLVNSLSLP